MVCVSGTVGKAPVEAHLDETCVRLTRRGKVWKTLQPLWLVYFQRVNSKLKTCVVVWGSESGPIGQTMPRADIESVQGTVKCPTYIGGLDPLPWSRYATAARKHCWTERDWTYLLSDDASSSGSGGDSSGDEDYVPPSSDADASDDDREDAPPAKRARTCRE